MAKIHWKEWHHYVIWKIKRWWKSAKLVAK